MVTHGQFMHLRTKPWFTRVFALGSELKLSCVAIDLRQHSEEMLQTAWPWGRAHKPCCGRNEWSGVDNAHSESKDGEGGGVGDSRAAVREDHWATAKGKIRRTFSAALEIPTSARHRGKTPLTAEDVLLFLFNRSDATTLEVEETSRQGITSKAAGPLFGEVRTPRKVKTFDAETALALAKGVEIRSPSRRAVNQSKQPKVELRPTVEKIWAAVDTAAFKRVKGVHKNRNIRLWERRSPNSSSRSSSLP
ncbi:hypothetical protein DM02DRAFT_733844 [Periconia macrospinosa]|uniref:Uncharacterized protein n=1 Tax=Periconia macrospinosa TaxID=97972 RepID=A0A2V1D4N8_9PLEO|nr:hypothetical protein DM02DRAFT_733844 [Periconia macrospinosa]